MGLRTIAKTVLDAPLLRFALGERFEFLELLRISLHTNGTRTKTSLMGKPFVTKWPTSFRYLYREIWKRQIYKFSCDHPKPFIIDAGANVGLATLDFKRQYPGAEIIAIEAMPDIAEILRQNLESFGYSDITILQKALSGSGLPFSFSPDPRGTAGRISADGPIRIESVRLSDLIGDRVVDFLKIDIEGAEYDVLVEAEEKLPQVNNLFLELHSRCDTDQRIDEALTIVRKAGFRVVIETGGAVAKQPFTETSSHKGLDVLLNVFATRHTG